MPPIRYRDDMATYDRYDPEPPELLDCRRCSRLVHWRERVALEKRRAYLDDEYWGRPVPGFGDSGAAILILGLAPGAHGANRTGRMFTGDASGAFLFPALHRCGFTDRPLAEHRNDGLQVRDIFVTSAVRCVPPQNIPTRGEIIACRPWLEREVQGLPNLQVVIGMGKVGHDAYLDLLRSRGRTVIKTRHPFGHANESTMPDGTTLLDTYHVSFRNTNSGKLTEAMLDAVLLRARHLVGI